MGLAQPKKFNKVNIEISNICNLQCTFCPEVIREKKMMDIELFRNIIRQVAPLTEQVTLHLMGEPLTHPKLEAMIEICAENKTPICLVSNAVLLNEKRQSWLLHPIIRQINFSLHAFPDNFPNQDPTAYLEKVFQFTERAFTQRPDLYLNYRLWNLQDTQGSGTQNQNMLEKICQRFSVPIPTHIDVTKHKSKKLLNRLYLHFDTEFVWPSLDLPILGTEGKCYGLSTHFGVLVDGTVVPCCLDKEGKIPLGKIQENSIQEILGSEKAQTILKGFQQRKLKDNLCQRCQYVTRFQPKTKGETNESVIESFA